MFVWLVALVTSAAILFICRPNGQKRMRVESHPSSIRFSPINPLDYSIKTTKTSKVEGNKSRKSAKSEKKQTTCTTREDETNSEANVSLTQPKPLEDEVTSLEPFQPPPASKVANRDVSDKVANSKDPQYATLVNIGQDWDSRIDKFDEFYDQVHRTQSSSGSCELKLKTCREDSFHNIQEVKNPLQSQ
ncbi:unnamed protein product [Bursaphelenchus xylophilus]|uniref:(pine wood nematode) hypothetical protein n=1 Tax=Bursaphelenchus xylophilus TaxID=6326 RepID=A0A1I7SLT0_BURXY|nr:unnamed protein product [Bursaphelenchus xylophilus]CAG9129816.1 unnamed protein product [Bursaphelenchus xylophilus]